MKLLTAIVTLTFLLLSGRAFGQVVVGTATFASASSATSSTTVTCGTGTVLIVGVAGSASATPTVSLSGETFTKLQGPNSFTSSNLTVFSCTTVSSHSGSTISATVSGASTSSIVVIPFTNSNGVDASAGSNGTAASKQTINVTSVHANDLAVGFEGSGSTASATAGTGYTIAANANTNPTGGNAGETGNTQTNAAGAAVTVAFGNVSSFPIIGVLLIPTSSASARRRISSSVVL